MSAVRTGIYTKFTTPATSALYTALDGTRFYYNEAEQDPLYPYCVYKIFGEMFDHTFDLKFENILIQFDCYGETADSCDTIIDAVKTLYDYAALTITGFVSIVMQRVDVMAPDKIQPDNKWFGIVRYELMIQKS